MVVVIIGKTELLPDGGKGLAVAAEARWTVRPASRAAWVGYIPPGSIDLEEHVLGLVKHNGLEVLANNDGHGLCVVITSVNGRVAESIRQTVVALGDGLRLVEGLEGAGKVGGKVGLGGKRGECGCDTVLGQDKPQWPRQRGYRPEDT